jgi:hypothetical protein
MASPDLAEWIDLEVQLDRDAERAPEELHARDGAIGRRIEARSLDDREATHRWLAEVRSENGPGAQAEHRRQQLSAALVLLGGLFGVLSVGGWLATATREPVNVIYFWPVFVGSQIAMALGFWITLVPGRTFGRLPLLGGFHALLRSLGAAIPRCVGRVFERLAPAGEEPVADSLARLQRLDWIYGGVRFWLLVQMTQLFALAFNVGALGAFVVLPAIDDPAFGWRSRLLDERQVVSASQIIAAPWSFAWPEALPTEAIVDATRYSSVAERYAADADRPGDAPLAESPWAAWWPFLVASIGFYGLAPRLLYLGVASLAARRALATVSTDRVEIHRVLERLRWPVMETTGIGGEDSGAWPEHAGMIRSPKAWPAPASARALCWVGVGLDSMDWGRRLEARFGTAPESLHPVGDLDPRGDEAALEAVAGGSANEGVYCVVASWEPPVGDPLDLLDAIRERIGPSRPILVVLHARGEKGEAVAPESRHRVVWERALDLRGDPHLFVAPLVPAQDEEAT